MRILDRAVFGFVAMLLVIEARREVSDVRSDQDTRESDDRDLHDLIA